MKNLKSKVIIAFKRCFILALIFTVILPHNAGALTASVLDMFAQNDIMFYDPDACKDDGGGGIVGGTAVVSGSTAAEKVWSGLKSMGISDEVTAGIMGNMMHESNSFNPAQHEGSFIGVWGTFDREHNTETSYGLGLIQWSFGRRVNMYKFVKDRSPGLVHYFEEPRTYSYENGSAYGCNGDCFIRKAASEEEANALYSLELTFLLEEFQGNDTYAGVLQQTTVYDAAKYFLEHVEIPQNPYISAHPERATDAQSFYDQYHGKTSFSGGGSTPSSTATTTDGSNVTWIGDSISEGSLSTISSKLPNADVTAKSSKSWLTDHTSCDASSFGCGLESGLTILRNHIAANDLREILVFALGTNDSGITDAKITELSQLVPDSVKRIVLMTLHDGSNQGVMDANNTAIKNAPSIDPRFAVADWKTAAEADVSKYISSDQVHPTPEGEELFVDTIIAAMGGLNNTGSAEECCDPNDGSNGGESIWEGAKYDLTDGQVNGILAMIMQENAGNVDAVKFEATLMANLYENSSGATPGNASGLVSFIQIPPGQPGHWFATWNVYDENYHGSDEYTNAVKDVLVQGNRTAPPEILEHDDPNDYSIYNDGVEADKWVVSNYIKGKTEIRNVYQSTYIFYTFANPRGTRVSSSSDGDGTGDPFGYFADKPPAGNGTKGANSSVCCVKDANVTTKQINGHTYAFPLAGATKGNYLNPGGEVESVLSKLPCPSLEAGVCHHDYYAVDMGLNKRAIDGHSYTAADFADKGGTAHEDFMYASTGVDVVAITSGEIMYTRDSYSLAADGWENNCGSVRLKGDDGNEYWMGHVDNENFAVQAGDRVEAGQKLAKVGAPQCAQNTQGHLHIHNNGGTGSTGMESGTQWIIELMNELYEALPDSDGGTGVSQCGSSELPAGGFKSVEDADKFMQEYKNLPSPQQDDPWDIKGNDFPDGCGASLANCVEFSLYFINRYTTAHFTGLPDGANVVSTLLSSDQGFTDGGHIPKPYAIFSMNSGSHGGCGHTGVVLGIDESAGKIIIGEAGCGASVDWIGAHEYELSSYTNNPIITYAYTDGILK